MDDATDTREGGQQVYFPALLKCHALRSQLTGGLQEPDEHGSLTRCSLCKGRLIVIIKLVVVQAKLATVQREIHVCVNVSKQLHVKQISCLEDLIQAGVGLIELLIHHHGETA